MEKVMPSPLLPMDQGQDIVVVYRGKEVVSQTPLSSGMTIARAAGVDVELNDTALSRNHAMP